MSVSPEEKLMVRSMVEEAGKPVPFFWPMRAFIHHNPLHGFEDLPFGEATTKGGRIFHARTFLPRTTYQSYLEEGRIDRSKLDAILSDFASHHEEPDGLDLVAWLRRAFYHEPVLFTTPDVLISAGDTHAVLAGQDLEGGTVDLKKLRAYLHRELLGERPLGEAIDSLYGSKVTDDLNELVIKSCLDFYDEGQSVWKMPLREEGFFNAWKKLAQRNFRFALLGLRFREILDADGSAEGTIIHVLRTLGIKEDQWAGCFTAELAQLHGWSGFIRWREQADDYYFNQKFPGDLVDFVAVRLTLALALIEARGRRGLANSVEAIKEMIDHSTEEAYLRYEFHRRKVLPRLAHDVDVALSRRKEEVIKKTFAEYVEAKRQFLAKREAGRLQRLASAIGQEEALARLDVEGLGQLRRVLIRAEEKEGLFWLRAMEEQAMHRLRHQLRITEVAERDDAPFAQALFCIDTRSERIRRQLEGAGDYETYGLAGFFGVPISFIEFGKGSEIPLCPVILTPENIVLEITTDAFAEDPDTLTTLEKAMYSLKESVVSPFVTVEAIGLLFGLEMIGKTLAPTGYAKWRKKLINNEKPETLLLLDKPDPEKADAILLTVQRALIIKAIKHDLGYHADQIPERAVFGLRQTALGIDTDREELCRLLKIESSRLDTLIEHLRVDYRINRKFAEQQREQLGRIGFTPEEQANFVATALRAIGLTRNFSRFVLFVGHGSFTDNNPYESALDCGACGGNHGLVSARVIAQMANRPEIRRRVAEMGIEIPDEVCFVPALHNTTTDEIRLHDLDQIPPSQLFHLDWLRQGLARASHLAAQERLPTLSAKQPDTALEAYELAQRHANDWSQVRPEWGLSRNCYFIIGCRDLTRRDTLEGRAFLHSYDYRVDPGGKLLESILTGPLVVGQWINMEHYFSAVDNEQFGSGSKVYHNVSGKFGVMSGNLSDLRTGLPAQTVLKDGKPYHEPVRLISVIEAPVEHARQAVEAVPSVRTLVRNEWIRLMVVDPETGLVHTWEDDEWSQSPLAEVPSELNESRTV